MKKTYLWLLTMLLPLVGMMSSCSDDDLVFDHELPQFEIQDGKILLEVIVPQGTNASDEIYIVGAFNGGEEAAVGNPQWALTKAEKTNLKWGVYLDPATFEPGTSLADGFWFVSVRDGREYDIAGNEAIHTDNPKTGTRTNIFASRWASYYGLGPNQGGEEGDDEGDDSYVPYLDSETEVSVFFKAKAEGDYCIWVWGDLGGGEAYTTAAAWPGDMLELQGQDADGNYIYKWTCTVTDQIPANIIITNQTGGEEVARYYDGVAFMNHGMYSDAGADPEEITQVGKPSGGGKKAFEPYLDSETEVSAFFAANAEGEYYVWVWGDLGGGEAYTTAAAWPGDLMELQGTTADGKFIYKWTCTVTGEAPANIIITDQTGGAENARFYDGAAFMNHGLYNAAGEDPTEVTKVK